VERLVAAGGFPDRKETFRGFQSHGANSKKSKLDMFVLKPMVLEYPYFRKHPYKQGKTMHIL
jgi:hypothetical protein